MEIGGIDANQIVTDLMTLERQPLLVLERRQEAAEAASQALSGVRTKVDAYRFASLKLAGSGDFGRFSTSSSSSAVVASAGSGAVPSSLSFTVAQLASNHGLRSVGTVSSSDSRITSAATLSIATGGAPVGVGSVRSGTGLIAGEYGVDVTQASAAASRRSDAALTGVTIAASEFIDLEIDGVAASIEINAGTYTAQELADAVDAGLTTAGLNASATLGADGYLTVRTDREGSAATVQFTGGSGLATIQMSVDASARVGTDAVVDVDGTTTTLTDLSAGGTVTVATGSGDLELDLTGGLRVGTLDVTTVDTGSGSLAEVASAINGSNADASAAAIRVGDNAWRLQLTSRVSGEQGELLIDDTLLADIGGLVESSAARDAQLVIGDGAGSYTVDSSSNTFSDVLVGTSLTVSATTTDPVTVGITRNDDALAADVSAMVAAANSVLADIKVQTRYGVDGIGNGALAGNGTVRRIADQLRSALSRPVEGFSELVGADVGIQIDKEGNFSFDSATFKAALAEDFGAVQRFFGRSATTPPGVTFENASAETVSGSYDVVVTTAATQATSARLADGGVATAARYGVRVGDLTATIDVEVGQSAADVIDALNAAFEATGLDLVAATDGTGLVVRSERWGESGDFELNTDVLGAGTWDAVVGADVEGTIDGVAATGIGRVLSLSSILDEDAAGLSIVIDGGVTGALGAVEYQPGLAARVAEVTTQMLAEDGTFDSAADAQTRRIESFNDQIEQFEDRLFNKEVQLRRQWSSLQTLLQQLQDRSAWIGSTLASLPQVNG